MSSIGPFNLFGLIFEADGPESDPPKDKDKDDDNPLQDEEQADQESNPLDGEAVEQAAPMAAPQNVASQQECEFVDLVLQAMTFSPKKIPAKALVVFDFTDPDRIVHFVKRVLNVHGKQKSYQSSNPLGGDEGSQELPFLPRQKHMLAQLLLKALKFDSKDMTVDSSMLSDEVTPENARSLEKELSMLLAI